MNKPLVSVLVPAYNADKYIGQCLESIVNQHYSNLQLVIVNDGSTDSTASLCDEFESRYPFVEVYHIPNGGVANARNLLLSKAKGEYTLFVDSDDWIEPGMVSNMVELSQTYKLDIVACGNAIEDGTNVVSAIHDSRPPIIWNQETAIEKFLLHKELNGSLWNKLVKTSLFHNISFDKRISYGEDAQVIWQVLQRIGSIGITKSTFYHYRMNAQSISHECFGDKKKSGHVVWENFVEDTESKFTHLAPLAKANFAVSDFWLLYYASLDKYPADSDITKYRQNLKKGLRAIRRFKLLDFKKYALAVSFSISYGVTSRLVRTILK